MYGKEIRSEADQREYEQTQLIYYVYEGNSIYSSWRNIRRGGNIVKFLNNGKIQATVFSTHCAVYVYEVKWKRRSQLPPTH